MEKKYRTSEDSNPYIRPKVTKTSILQLFLIHGLGM